MAELSTVDERHEVWTAAVLRAVIESVESVQLGDDGEVVWMEDEARGEGEGRPALGAALGNRFIG